MTMFLRYVSALYSKEVIPLNPVTKSYREN